MTKETKKTNLEEKTVTDQEETKQELKKKKIKCLLVRERVLTENSDEARLLNTQSVFGSLLNDGRVQLSLLEAFYLMSKDKIEVYDYRNKLISPDDFLKKARKVEPNFWVRYCVFKDIRDRGYIIKTALKFGADFRVYDRGLKPGESHAKWIVYPVHEAENLTWYEFAAKNRVAHSTKKKLLIGIVDDESDVTYYEIRWIRP
ncbi:MAG: tRNA-intron lyase [Candidatus Woesearchaeota archaeon]